MSLLEVFCNVVHRTQVCCHSRLSPRFERERCRQGLLFWSLKNQRKFVSGVVKEKIKINLRLLNKKVIFLNKVIQFKETAAFERFGCSHPGTKSIKAG